MQSKAIYQEKSVRVLHTYVHCTSAEKESFFVIFIVYEQSTVVQTTNPFGQTNFFLTYTMKSSNEWA